MENEAATYCLELAELSGLEIFSFDVELSQFIYRNQAFKEHLFFAGDTLLKDDLEALIHPEDFGLVNDSYEELLHGKRKKLEFRVLMPDQTIRTIRLEAFLISNHARAQVISGIIEDITAFKEHNDTLNKFSNKKNSLLNILSHDLLAPLGSIQNLSTLIQKKTHNSENIDLHRFVNAIEKISRRSIELIRSLLSQEFIESAAAELVLRRTNLVVPLRDCVEQYKASEEITKRTFNLLAANETIMADIDETKFIQAINNLVSNAIKFTQQDGTIEISIKEELDHVLITVSDNGIGIPEKHHELLFDKFTSARRRGLRGESSHGLGMSIIKTIVEWHHGEITFKSKENEGTTFYLKLPCPAEN